MKLQKLALGLIVLISSGTLIACAESAREYEESLLDLSKTSLANHKLPDPESRNGWNEMIVVCPYDVIPDSSDSELLIAASRVDTGATDSVQTLFFSIGDEIVSITVARDRVDFCVPSHQPGRVYPSDALWEIKDPADGPIHIVPVEDR